MLGSFGRVFDEMKRMRAIALEFVKLHLERVSRFVGVDVPVVLEQEQKLARLSN
jgi:hypothetical protein